MDLPPKNIFRLRLRIREEDIDQLGHVNNVVYLQWVQDASAAHWQQLSTHEERKWIAWVVLRHEIDYKLPALPADLLIAETWVGETGGLKSIRHVMIKKEHGAVIAEARTTWVPVDPVNLRPRRITPEILSILERSTDN
jgi:acyl-CoA thioester hydrolase